MSRVKYFKKLICQPAFKFFLDADDGKDIVFLSSTARSGSTWIQNVISGADDFRVMFEPFNYKKTRGLRHLPYRNYLSSEDQDEQIFKGVDKILRGRFRNKWLDRDNQCHFPKKRFIKAIRSNWMLSWIKQNFPEVKQVFLLRNPFSVADSFIRMGRTADNLDIILKNELLVNRHLKNDPINHTLQTAIFMLRIREGLRPYSSPKEK